MLKMFLGVWLSVVVLLSSAYVPFISGAHAASADVIITQIQAGAAGAPTQEFIVVYNNSPLEVDVSGWCLTNKNNATIGCFTPSAGPALYIPGYKHAVVASNTLPVNLASVVYEPLSQSSGSITGSVDKISLVDHRGIIVDQHSWTSPITSGMHFARIATQVRPTFTVYQVTEDDSASDWTIVPTTKMPKDEVKVEVITVDVCPNIEGDQQVVPSGMVLSEIGECVDRIIITVNITEVFPNAPGSDTGKEFIELYNPNDFPVDLSDYRLYVGPQYENEYLFPLGTIIEPLSYKSFSNSDIPFSLLNTSSKIALSLSDGTSISEVPAYQDPKEGQSWILIDGTWQYSTTPTPGSANVAGIDGVQNVEVILQPCAANQYRSLETNRCRLISSSAGTIAACKDGQYRSEETNRCRNIATDAKIITPCEEDEERNLETNRCRKIVTANSPTPCKEGQERSPDTNRCKTVKKMPSSDYGVLGAKVESGGNWYAFAAIGGVLLIAIGYAVWEWHNEIGKFLQKVRKSFIRFLRARK